MTHSLLQHFTFLPLGSPALTSIYPLLTIYPLTPTTFYAHWQPSSNLIIPPLSNCPTHFYNILPFSPLAAQLLPHFTPFEQITPSLLYHFMPLAAQLLAYFTPSEQITPSFLNHFNPLPLGSPALTSFYPLWTIHPLTLTTFYPPLAAQLLPHFTPFEQITPSLLYHFIPPAAHFWAYFTPSEQTTPSFLSHFNPLPLGSPALTSFYPLWTVYSLTLTTFYNRGSPVLTSFHPPEQITPSFLNHFNPLPLGSPALTSFYPLWTVYSLTLSTFYNRCSPVITSFYPLWTNYPLILKPF